MHYEVAPSDDAPEGEAVVEIFRFSDAGYIDDSSVVRQAVVSPTASGRTMFDGGGDPEAASDTSANKAAVERLYAEAFNAANVAVIDELVAPGYVQHNPALPDGSAALKGLLSAGLPAEIIDLVAQGDLVVAHVDYPGVPAVDIFRFQDGKIVEHWDVLQST